MKDISRHWFFLTSNRRSRAFTVLFICISFFSFSQVSKEVDTTKIRIGEQINYKLKVEVDSLVRVVFPEGQTFTPLEAVEGSAIDTTKNGMKYVLYKIYKLTQFDSGSYTIPRQKVIINEESFFTDSLRVHVNTVAVDTTKQKLYDIKPIIAVEKNASDWWKWLLVILLSIAVLSFLLWWFIWRKKPLTKEEEIALLPPYDRAKIALKALDNKAHLSRSDIKSYYSELTLIIRTYLDKTIYNRSLESTTDQLISRLQLLKSGNTFNFTNDTITNLEMILKRADLVKFAKSAPDEGVVEMDRTTIEKEIDSVKAMLPEPDEEEKLLDQHYKAAQARKTKQRKLILTTAIVSLLLVTLVVGFSLKYGFKNVKDTILRHETKVLLEGEWVKSVYGVPPVYIETPEVLMRLDNAVPEAISNAFSRTVFGFTGAKQRISVSVMTTTARNPESQQKQDNVENNVAQSIDQILNEWESRNVKNIVSRGESYTTPNGVEGYKTFGSGDFPIKNSDTSLKDDFAIFSFATKESIIHISLIWAKEDSYTKDIATRIINSIELKSEEQVNAEQEDRR